MKLTRLIVVVLASLTVFAGCEVFTLSQNCNAPQDDFTFYSQMLGIDLPDSTREFRAACSGFMDHQEYRMQFNIAPSDLAALQDGLSGDLTWAENAPLSERQLERLRQLVSARAISQMRAYVLGADSFNNRIVVVDTSDPQVYRVYLYVFITF